MPPKPESFPDFFLGFQPAALDFLRTLAIEQNREWFTAHKAVYDAEVLGPMVALVGELSVALPQRGLPFQGRAGRSVFRIHRDVRFSKDKRPYKTHIGAAITRDGEKMSPGVLYVHIDPEGSFVAAGFHQPEPDVLQLIRNSIVGRPDDFREVIETLEGSGLTLSADSDALKRLPRGFEAVTEEDIADALRRRSFITSRHLSEADIASPDLVNRIVDFADAASPLLDFGWAAIAR